MPSNGLLVWPIYQVGLYQVWHKNFIPNDSLNEPKKKSPDRKIIQLLSVFCDEKTWIRVTWFCVVTCKALRNSEPGLITSKMRNQTCWFQSSFSPLKVSDTIKIISKSHHLENITITLNLCHVPSDTAFPSLPCKGILDSKCSYEWILAFLRNLLLSFVFWTF